MNQKLTMLAALTVLAAAAPLIAQRGRTPPAEAPREDEAADVAHVYFTTADRDSNGWISFSEAEASMQLDRPAFALYDVDRDGRVTEAEFTARYRKLVRGGGKFAAPKGVAEERAPKKHDPEELVLAYDVDRDAALDAREIANALEEAGAREIDAEELLRKLDLDRDGSLKGAELEELRGVLSPGEARTAAPKVASVEALFGIVRAREAREGMLAQPPRIVGPVPLFRRLDLDGDGKISLADLTDLQRPLQPTVRVATVFATLDVDGNGAIDAHELRQSMRTGSP